MCWNAEVSLQSFLLGILAISIGIVFKMSFSVIVFCLTIVLMQLIEYIVWTNYENDEINQKASIAAAGLLWLQPIAAIFTIPTPNLRTSFLTSYILLSIGVALLFNKNEYSMKRAPNGHLEWKWLTKDSNTYISLAIYFLFLLSPLFIAGNIDILFLAITTLVLSVYSFWKDNTWGSMWCWIVNGLVLLVVGKTVIKNTN
jgi:hypothetical protein